MSLRVQEADDSDGMLEAPMAETQAATTSASASTSSSTCRVGVTLSIANSNSVPDT